MGTPMTPTHVPRVEEALQSLQEHARLVGLVQMMVKEIERLDQDNAQLRAAVEVYREVVRAWKQSAAGQR
jgi:hypothetical protein